MDGMLFDLEALLEGKEDIQAVIKQLTTTCQACRLSFLHPYNRGLLYRGNPLAKIAVLAEAPGDKETEQGQPLVGASGREWERWAASIGLNTTKDAFHTNVIQCFTGSSRVKARDIVSLYRRWYVGAGLEVRTKHGVFTCTPNHPILTMRGWIPSSKLNKADYLIHGDFVDSSGSYPNVHNGFTRFDDLFDAFSESRNPTRMIGSCMDFHGDGSDSDIDVVATENFLMGGIEPSSSQRFEYFLLETATHTKRLLSTYCPRHGSFIQGVQRLGFALGSSVRLFRDSDPIFSTGSLESLLLPLGLGSESNTHSIEPFHKSLVANPNLLSENSNTFPSKIAPCEILEIRDVYLSEHVYNLSTRSRQYVTEGIITHNCQPHKVMREEKLAQEAPDKDEIKACFATRGLRVLKAMPNLEVVITLGWVAAKALLGGEPKGRSHEGNWFESNTLPGIAIFCLVHPSYVLRDPTPEKDLRVSECMKAFKREYLESGKCYQLAQTVKAQRDEQRIQ